MKRYLSYENISEGDINDDHRLLYQVLFCYDTVKITNDYCVDHYDCNEMLQINLKE